MGMGWRKEWGGKVDGPACWWLCPLLPFFGAQKVWVNVWGAAVKERLIPAGFTLPSPSPPCSVIPSGASLGPGSCVAHSESWSSARSSVLAWGLPFFGSDAGPGRAAPPQLLGSLGVTLGQHPCGVPQAALLTGDKFCPQAGAEPDISPWI